MKRKLFSLALVAALVFALSVSAFAAADTRSGNPDDVLVTPTQGEITDGSQTKSDEINNEILEDKVFDDKNVRDFVSNLIPKDKEEKVEAIGYHLLAAFEFSLPEASAANPVKVTFNNVPNVTEGSSVLVLHQKSDGSWEVLDSKVVGEGSVEATFTSASPVAIYTVTIRYSSDSTTPPANNNTSTTTVKSPQTSDIG